MSIASMGFLLVASVEIITTLWASVIEHIGEIGILKAIGFSNQRILRLFLIEAILTGIIEGTLGMISGVELAFLTKNF